MNIDGIEIRVTRKNIRNLHLYIKPPDGRVEITAPLHADDAELEAFARSRMNWIRSHLEKMAQRPRPMERKYVTGEPFCLWGRNYELVVVRSHRADQLVITDGKAFFMTPETTAPEQRKAFLNEWYRDVLKREVEKRLPEWEKSGGLYCSGWSIKNMKTRWGTCNTVTKKIWLNLQLAKLPLCCLDLVINHELAHLRVRDHSELFTALMDRLMPSWRDVDKLLNEQSISYLESL